MSQFETPFSSFMSYSHMHYTYQCHCIQWFTNSRHSFNVIFANLNGHLWRNMFFYRLMFHFTIQISHMLCLLQVFHRNNWFSLYSTQPQFIKTNRGNNTEQLFQWHIDLKFDSIVFSCIILIILNMGRFK